MYQVHIWNKTTQRTVKYYTTVHRRKYQLHFKNVVSDCVVASMMGICPFGCMPL